MSGGCPVCGAARDGWPLCEECTRLVREAAEHPIACGCRACGRYVRAENALGYDEVIDVVTRNTLRGGA